MVVKIADFFLKFTVKSRWHNTTAVYIPTYTQGMSMTEIRGAALNTHFSMLNFNNYVEICFKSNTEFSNMMSFLVK